MAKIWKSTIHATDFGPFPKEKVDVVEGDFHEMLHVIRTSSADEGGIEVGVSITDRPSRVRYTFEGDHTVYIVVGTINVTLDDGESVDLQAGDVASFAKGATCVWTVVEPTTEIYVTSG
jgi:uncharacterized cupin superfamily protein